MSVSELLERMTAQHEGASFEWNKARAEIVDEFRRATTTPERVALLSVYKLVMDAVEGSSVFTPEDMAKIKELRGREYIQMLLQEAVRPDGLIDPQKMKEITRREIEAGRMAPDDSLHELTTSYLAQNQTNAKPTEQVSQRTNTDELRLRRTEVAFQLAEMAAGVMKLQIKAVGALSKIPPTSDEIASPAMAFASGLLLTALHLRGIPFTEEALVPGGPRLVLIEFVKQWLSDSVGNREEMADCIAEAAQKPELVRYFKHSEIAFRRFDATINDKVTDDDLAKYNDDFARALGVV